MLSGGRDSVCMLDLAVRARGAEAVTALHVNYGLRDDSDADERHCAELCERLGVELAVERPRRPEGPGNLQAWARDSRYAAAAAARRCRARRRSSPATPPTTRSRRSSTGSPPRRAAGRCWGCGRATAAWPGRCSASTRAETTAYCEERGLAWRDDPTNAEPTYARNRIRHGLLPELAKIHPAAAANVLRTAALLRDEAEVLDALVDAELDGSGGAPAARSRCERLGELPPALRRLVVQRLADGAAGRPVPGAARFAEQVAGLRRTGSRCSTSAAASAPWSRAASSAPSATPDARCRLYI